MTDIVERLRAHAWEYATTIGPTFDEAADDIERLREALGEMVDFGAQVSGWHSGILDRARAALKSVGQERGNFEEWDRQANDFLKERGYK